MIEPFLWYSGALFLLGAYHGINPGMGWLFAVALGMQEQSARAVRRSLLPLALGHGISIGVAVAVAAALQIVVPLTYLKAAVALFLVGLGCYKFFRNRHPRWVGMRVGFRDLTLWSFLMASAHGAGFMILPIFLGLTNSGDMGAHASHTSLQMPDPYFGLGATIVHTLGYLVTTGAVAWLFYQKLGLAILQKAWINLDLIWAIALVLTGLLTLLL